MQWDCRNEISSKMYKLDLSSQSSTQEEHNEPLHSNPNPPPKWWCWWMNWVIVLGQFHWKLDMSWDIRGGIWYTPKKYLDFTETWSFLKWALRISLGLVGSMLRILNVWHSDEQWMVWIQTSTGLISIFSLEKICYGQSEPSEVSSLHVTFLTRSSRQ